MDLRRLIPGMAREQKGLLMVASVGPEIEPVLVGVRDYSIRKLILLYTPDFKTNAQDIVAKVKPILVDTEMREINGDDVLMDTLRQVSEIQAVDGLQFQDMIINVSSGDKMQTCSALSAAFVHGVPAIGVGPMGCFPMPVLKFSYAELISDAKYRIMETLDKLGGSCDSLADLSKASGVEKSLLSYHLRTTREGKGLEDMGLVSIDRGSLGRLGIELTEMGRLMLLGRGSKTTGANALAQ
jgi:DNA-binding transcriptional ArsR family regulator